MVARPVGVPGTRMSTWASGRPVIRLVMHRRQAPLTERLLPENSTCAGGEVPQAPAQEYAIRRLRADEMLQVAQCIYRAYGYSYPNKDLYYPARIAHLNATGEPVAACGPTAPG